MLFPLAIAVVVIIARVARVLFLAFCVGVCLCRLLRVIQLI